MASLRWNRLAPRPVGFSVSLKGVEHDPFNETFFLLTTGGFSLSCTAKTRYYKNYRIGTRNSLLEQAWKRFRTDMSGSLSHEMMA